MYIMCVLYVYYACPRLCSLYGVCITANVTVFIPYCVCMCVYIMNVLYILLTTFILSRFLSNLNTDFDGLGVPNLHR